MYFRRRLVLSALLGLGLLIAGVARSAEASPTAFAIDGTTIGGESHSIGELRGKIVVVNFWATWCFPCREELPILETLSRKYAERGVIFVALSVDDDTTRAKIPAALEEAGVTFPVWSGADARDMVSLGLGTALPATAVIGTDGEVEKRLLGPITADWLSAKIDAVLEDGPIEACDHEIAADEHAHEHDRSATDDSHGDGHTCTDDHDHGHDHGLDGSIETSVSDPSLVPS